MSRSSVKLSSQTMAAGTPIFGVVPWGGVVATLSSSGGSADVHSADPTDIAATLRNWMANPRTGRPLAKRAHKVLK